MLFCLSRFGIGERLGRAAVQPGRFGLRTDLLHAFPQTVLAL